MKEKLCIPNFLFLIENYFRVVPFTSSDQRVFDLKFLEKKNTEFFIFLGLILCYRRCEFI